MTITLNKGQAQRITDTLISLDIHLEGSGTQTKLTKELIVDAVGALLEGVQEHGEQRGKCAITQFEERLSCRLLRKINE